MATLKPCPFCGAEAKDSSYRSCDCCGKAFNGRVVCSSCEAEVSHFDSAEEAYAAWNRRASDPSLEEAISLLETASVSLWNFGGNAKAREIDKFLDRVSPDGRARTDAALSEDRP